MSSTATARRRLRPATGAVLALAVVASGATPLLAGTAVAQTAVLPTPVVVGPVDPAPVRKEAVLDWAPVAGAQRYRVQVGTDDQWSDLPTYTADTVASRLTLPAWLPHASYVWRVAALGDGSQSRWGTGGAFTRGWLTKPVLQPVTLSGWLPTFSWSPVPTASEYQLQVSTSPYFNDRAPTTTQAGGITESCFTTRTSITPFNSQATPRNDSAGDCDFSRLGSGETLHWRVRGLDHVVDGMTEVDTTPVVDEGISHLPPAPAGELDTSACPDEETPSNSCDPAHAVEKGAWSVGSPVTSTAQAPAPDDTRRYEALPRVPTHPVTGSPLCDAAAVCRDFPTLTWDPVEGADWYRLYVSLDQAYTNLHEIIETPGTSWTPTTQWRDRTTAGSYFYAVQPCTTTGSTPGCGPVTDQPLSFRKSSPRLATSATPNGPESVLSWQGHSDAMRAAGVPASSEAYAYHVQVTGASDPDFVGTLVDEATVDATHYVSATRSYPQGAYLWRVQAVDASGHRLPWSAARRFVKDTVRPTVTVSPAAVIGISSAVTLRFSEPVTGVGTGSVALQNRAVTVTPSADGRSAVVRPTSRLVPGAAYAVGITSAVRDLAGNPLVARTVVLKADGRVDDRSPAVAYAGSWSRLSASNAVSGTFSRSVPTTAAQTTGTVVLFGGSAEVKGCVGPYHGVVDVYADGVRVKRVDTYRSYSGCGVVLARFAFPSGQAYHRVQVRGTGLKQAASKGTAATVDVVTALP